MSDSLDYIYVLKALKEIPFNVGKKLLVDFLRGDMKNDSIIRNDLDNLPSFGSLGYEPDEIHAMIDRLILNNLIKTATLKQHSYWKVLEITREGEAEIEHPILNEKKACFGFEQKKTIITDADKKAFAALDSFLNTYNDEQKKAIISPKNYILCIAGAGSGKTTVLSKRIEFLTKYRSVNPKNILAITFTRKARQEMMSRISEFDPQGKIRIETFNSFCEKFLRKHNDLIYDKPVKVLTYRDKIVMVNRALQSLNTDINRALSIYFTPFQRKGKSDEQLASIFVNDCFFIRDYFRFKNQAVDRSLFTSSDSKYQRSADMVYSIVGFIEDFMYKNGLRDFADQLLDSIALFKQRPDLIPKFEHILIDEYQDVNSSQIEFVDLLNPKNVFAVGDPRQSIFGWRGSDVKFILSFEDKYPDCEIISLVKNYRSSSALVNFMNKAIEPMGLPDLESANEFEKDINLLKFSGESLEFEFVVQRILAADVPRNEIFVLARTNRQLNELSKVFDSRNIRHVVKSDEVKRMTVAGPDDVTLATVHAIKGLEAEMVFVIGANSQNFPCKGSEHPVVDMVKVDEYDAEEEERRLFYVAISRPKKTLYISYTGTRPTHFITSSMLSMLKEKKLSITSPNSPKSAGGDIMNRLRDWRKTKALELGVPAYILMHDKSMIDITQKNPMTLAELEEIHGLGPTKVMKYGEELLDVIRG